MTKTIDTRPLDRDEAEMVERSRALTQLSSSELKDLIGRLRARRDKAQRQIRTRARAAQGRGESAGADTGAREKKALLTDAIGRVSGEMAGRRTGQGAAQARRAHPACRATAHDGDMAHFARTLIHTCSPPFVGLTPIHLRILLQLGRFEFCGSAIRKCFSSDEKLCILETWRASPKAGAPIREGCRSTPLISGGRDQQEG